MSETLIPAFLLLFVVIITSAILNSAGLKGKRGEARVRRYLERSFAADANTLLNDITLPTSDGSTQIDHILLNRSGIFVIETKFMAGWIFGTAKQSNWTQTFYRHKTRFKNPLHQNYRHIKAIQSLLNLDLQHLHNIVVFAGSATKKTAMPANVIWKMRHLTSYIQGHDDIVFSDSEVREFAQILRDTALAPGRQTNRAHIENLKAREKAKAHSQSVCPRCASALVERTNKKTGDRFLGCTNFPSCRGTRRLT